MTNDQALLQVVTLLAKEGISTRTTNGEHSGLVIWFEDGFYKSDGFARLIVEDGRLFLLARYGEKTEISSIDDIVNRSFEWHSFSQDRFDGWAVPPPHWRRLYEKLGHMA